MTINSNSINLLRSAGILYIVGFWHLMEYVKNFSGFMNETTYGLAILALSSFTILSGYLLGQKPVPLTRVGLADFYRRRLIRIYPPMVLAVILLVGIRFFDIISGLKSILLLGAVIPPAPSTIWYISVLVIFYAIAPFLIAARRAGLLPYAAMTTAATVAMLALHISFGLFDSRTIIYMPCFALGIALAQEDLSKANRIFAFVVVCTVLSYLYCLTTPINKWATSVTTLPFALFSSWAVLITVFKLPLPEKEIRWIAFLASASLFMYLFHRVFYRLFRIVIERIPDPYVGLAAMYLIALPTVIILSWWGQRYYDRVIVARIMADRRQPGVIR